MIPKSFEDLPAVMKKPAVRPYYDALSKHRFSLCVKRCFDIFASLLMIIILSPLIIGISVAVKISSPGPVFFRQVRISKYGKEFRIYKFRSMIVGADKIGPLVTTDNDSRITGVGHFIRKTHFDEIPQLFNVLAGDMSFVGTRPEVKKYVDKYTDEMMATLLLPAGITSEASIDYRDEAQLISDSSDADSTYINVVLPAKMKLNLKYLSEFSLLKDLNILIRTFLLLFRR
ncbi:MAG: sugar transferase [Oscillospiraceae bacterium]|nr:sugar transferase [Oscillospiraceae bacterium]